MIIDIPTTSPNVFQPGDIGLPFDKFRPQQYETAIKLLESSRRFSLLSAPTGVGKSLILMTYAMLHGGRVLYLVGTKGLQRQLLDFQQVAKWVYGKTNYRCNLLQSSTCDKGPCNLGDYCHLKKTGCDYYDAIEYGRQSRIVVDNYAQWFSLAKTDNHGALGQFDAVLCDEAHGILDWLTSFASVTITERRLKHLLNVDFNTPSDIDHTNMSWIEWAATLHTLAQQRYRDAQQDESLSRDEMLQLLELGRGLRTLSSCKVEYPWTVERTFDPSRGLTFTPVWPRYFAEQLLYRDVPRVVLSSATLHNVLTRYLSIPDCDEISLPSPFDPRNRPLYIMPIVRVDNKMTAGNKSLLWTACDNIISARPNVRTVIHTHSYDRAKEFINATRHKAIVISHTSSKDLEQQLQLFFDTATPVVFVSPSVAEGHDFAGDKARCQIILKVPFLPPDVLTTARRQHDKQYSNYVPALTIEQQYGRLVRSVDDWGETFILDRHFSDHFHRQPYFQQWFRDAWRWVNSIPEGAYK